jgi:hypothetical protein
MSPLSACARSGFAKIAMATTTSSCRAVALSTPLWELLTPNGSPGSLLGVIGGRVCTDSASMIPWVDPFIVLFKRTDVSGRFTVRLFWFRRSHHLVTRTTRTGPTKMIPKAIRYHRKL